jgi:hypothetical protein
MSLTGRAPAKLVARYAMDFAKNQSRSGSFQDRSHKLRS